MYQQVPCLPVTVATVEMLKNFFIGGLVTFLVGIPLADGDLIEI